MHLPCHVVVSRLLHLRLLSSQWLKFFALGLTLQDRVELLEESGWVTQALILNLSARCSNMVLVAHKQVQESLDALLIVGAARIFLELAHEDTDGHDELGER